MKHLTFVMIMFLALAAAPFGCDDAKEETAQVIRPVRFQPVFATGGNRIREFSGSAKAGLESTLSFRVPGIVQSVAVKVGDRVRSGQVIAALDPQDYNLREQSADAALAQAQAQARNASAAYDRARAMYESRNSSLNDLVAARAAHESAKAGVRAAQKQLELARSQLAYARLTAPVAGAIAEVSTEVNENVSAGQPIARLTSGSRLEVEVAVPEILISQIRNGQQVTVAFDAIPSTAFNAAVSEVGVASTGLVTTFPVTAILETDAPEVRPGMAAHVAFEFSSGDDRERFVVPPAAVGEDRDGRFVFTVKATETGRGVVSRKTVEVGDLRGDGLEILDGLTDGDLLVTAGVSMIVDGQTVALPSTEESQL